MMCDLPGGTTTRCSILLSSEAFSGASHLGQLSSESQAAVQNLGKIRIGLALGGTPEKPLSAIDQPLSMLNSRSLLPVFLISTVTSAPAAGGVTAAPPSTAPGSVPPPTPASAAVPVSRS